MIKVSGISLSLSPSEVRERIARRLLLTESPGFERSLSDHRLPGRGGQGELGQGCPQPWTEGSSPSRNSHSRDPRAAGKAAAATLSVIVGGLAETFAASEDLFRAMGKNVFHVGGLGHGLAMKLINNMLDQIATVAIAEALVFGKKAGLDPPKNLRGHARQYRQQRAVRKL